MPLRVGPWGSLRSLAVPPPGGPVFGVAREPRLFASKRRETVDRVRVGIRLQLLAVLGVLLALAFLPLFFAVQTSTKLGLYRHEERSAGRLAASVAGHLAEIHPRLTPEELPENLGQQVAAGITQVVLAVDAEGILRAAAGEPKLLEVVRRSPRAVAEARRTGRLRAFGRDFASAERRSPSLAFVAFVEVAHDDEGPRRLGQLLGLTMFVSAVAVLAFAYHSLTRLVIRPILAIDQSARRVAEGGRSLVVGGSFAPELVRLSHSLQTLTEQLRGEEDRLRGKIAELETARRELASAQSSLVRSERLATVGQLAAGLAHEIGNPLSALLGFVDLLDQGDLTPEEERDFLERMRREIQRIHRVLRDLLTYARAGSADSGGDRATGSYALAIQTVVALLSPQKDFSRLTIETHVAPELPPAPLSTEELTQVLLNLAINAAHATGGVGRLVLEGEITPEAVVVRVDDDGPGVPASIRETLFEPFVSTKEAGQGSGLGLSVARGLVESAGGQLILAKSPLGGARFELRLPTSESAPKTRKPAR